MRTLKTIILMAIVAMSLSAHAQTHKIDPMQPFNPQYRDVYWMHGLNGRGHYMQALADYFGDEYEMNSYSPEYPATQGIVAAANYWHGFNFRRDGRNDHFVVTQSMGGLVARYYDQHYSDNRFGGLITIAAPHLGSQFANSFDNGHLKSFFDGALNNGVEGFKKAIEDTPLITLVLGYKENLISDVKEGLEKLYPGLIDDEKSDAIKRNIIIGAIQIGIFNPPTEWGDIIRDLARIDVMNIVCELQIFGVKLMTKALETVFGVAENGVYIGKEELKYNSPMVQSINNGAAFHNKNTINIVGRKDGNIGIKFLGSTIKSKKLKNFNKESIDAVTDNDLQEFINIITTKTQTLSENFNTVANLSGWASALHFLTGEPLATIKAVRLLNKRSECKDIAAAFTRTTNYWRYTFEQRYEACLGNKYYTTSTETYYERVWVDDGPGHGAKPIEQGPIDFIEDPIIGDDRPGSDNGHWEYIPRTYTVTHTHTHPSDGIVTVPSQEGWNASVTLYVDNVDHESVKRSSNTVNELKKVFNGQYGNFFYTKKREKAPVPEPEPEPLPKPVIPRPIKPGDGPILKPIDGGGEFITLE